MTNPNKRQVKITNLWRKGGTRVPEDCEELDEEIKQLEQKLKDKQKELFQAQRQSYKRNLAPKKTNFIAQFVRPEKIVAQNNIEHLERSIELMSMLTGMEVKSYVAEAHCVIVYHMQHKSENAVEHGLKINMKPEQNAVSKFSLPLGFNFNAVVEDFDNIMTAECLGSIRKALVAYYDRLEQYQSLKEYLSLEGQLFKLLDGTHMEVTFKILSDLDEEDEVYEMLLMLDYRVYDIRPKQYTLNSSNLPDSAAEVLREQCAIFKRQPLKQAFKECFVKGNGPYKFVHQVSAAAGDMPKPRRQKRARTTHYNPNNDDTFRPEDCSSSEEDEARQMDHYGRYTLRNVARCWTYETSLLVDENISNELPLTEYLEFFAPDFTLHPEISRPESTTNANSKQYLEAITKHVYDNLKMCQHSPAVQMTHIPGDFFPDEYRIKEEPDPDVRQTQEEVDKAVEPKNDFFDDERDQERDEKPETKDP